jgi:branched-chain amino acid transport system ATP-binding protein
VSALLEIDGLSKVFGGLMALCDVSFQVKKGEIFGLIGPNGAGKTTLFNMLTGLSTATKGEVRFQGQTIGGLKPERIAMLGVARTFQNIRLFNGLPVLDNVKIPQHAGARTGFWAGLCNTGASRSEEREITARAKELLELVGLAGSAEQLAGSLPYGDRRRLEIARALALNPKLLLLDEPAAGMNPAEKLALSEFIRQIRDRFELTVLFIEHNVPMVMGLCQRIAVLNFGQCIAVGSPETVQSDPGVIEAYLGSAHA